MFEEKIRKNAEVGNSSLPSHYDSKMFGKEGKRNFKISNRKRSERPVLKPSSVQDLTKELAAVISQLKHSEAQHKEISNDISLLPKFELRPCRRKSSTITEESGLADREEWLPEPVPLELDQSGTIKQVGDGTSDHDDSCFVAKILDSESAEIAAEEKEENYPKISHEEKELSDRTKASILVQKNVRGFLTRKKKTHRKATPPATQKQISNKTKADALRSEIEAMQQKLDMFSEETLSKFSELQKSYDDKKSELLHAKQEITNARQQAKIAEEKSPETRQLQLALRDIKDETTDLRSSNVEHRATRIQLAREMKSLKIQQKRLERENIIISEQFKTLSRFARKFEAENRKLTKVVQACKGKYKPLWRAAILESRASGASEQRQNRKYRKTIYQVLSRVSKWTVEQERKSRRNLVQSDPNESHKLLLELERIAEELMKGQGHHRMGPWNHGSFRKDDHDSVFTKSTEQDSYADSDDSSSSSSEDSWDSFVDDEDYGGYYFTPSHEWGEDTERSLGYDDFVEDKEAYGNAHHVEKKDKFELERSIIIEAGGRNS